MYYPNLWPVLEKSIHSFVLSKTVNCGTLVCGTSATFRVFQASGGQRVTSVKKAPGARLSQGEERVKKQKNKKTSTHAVSPRASSSARLKSQINLAPVSQDRENSTIRVLAIFKCFYLPCSSFETFKNSNSLFHVLILVYIGKFINLRLIEYIVFSQSKRTLKRSLFYLMVWH